MCITICDLSLLWNSARSSLVSPSGGSLQRMEEKKCSSDVFGELPENQWKMNRQQTDIKDVIDGRPLCVWLWGRNMKPKGKSWLQSSKDGLDAQVWHRARGLWFCGARIRFLTCLCGCRSCQSWGCEVLYQAAYLLPNRLSAGEDRSVDMWRNRYTTLTHPRFQSLRLNKVSEKQVASSRLYFVCTW